MAAYGRDLSTGSGSGRRISLNLSKLSRSISDLVRNSDTDSSTAPIDNLRADSAIAHSRRSVDIGGSNRWRFSLSSNGRAIRSASVDERSFRWSRASEDLGMSPHALPEGWKALVSQRASEDLGGASSEGDLTSALEAANDLAGRGVFILKGRAKVTLDRSSGDFRVHISGESMDILSGSDHTCWTHQSLIPGANFCLTPKTEAIDEFLVEGTCNLLLPGGAYIAAWRLSKARWRSMSSRCGDERMESIVSVNGAEQRVTFPLSKSAEYKYGERKMESGGGSAIATLPNWTEFPSGRFQVGPINGEKGRCYEVEVSFRLSHPDIWMFGLFVDSLVLQRTSAGSSLVVAYERSLSTSAQRSTTLTPQRSGRFQQTEGPSERGLPTIQSIGNALPGELPLLL
eukprot:TRINITY_DN6625_c0_g3_i1.p1 TRINITY_DN6625_c0_g3~~TRINITY_DN6625_c0_g3_i1.p1  ORF type:complete len:400 (-),score=34.31 TRINITY_DN6625_c0_g3_i1:76-1275(-)